MIKTSIFWWEKEGLKRAGSNHLQWKLPEYENEASTTHAIATIIVEMWAENKNIWRQGETREKNQYQERECRTKYLKSVNTEEPENIAVMFEEAENIAVVVISSASFALARNPRTTSQLTWITHPWKKKE